MPEEVKYYVESHEDGAPVATWDPGKEHVFTIRIATEERVKLSHFTYRWVGPVQLRLLERDLL